MPWVDPTPDAITLESPMGTGAAPATVADPGPVAVFGAAFSRENILVNAARKLSEEKYPVDPSYNPMADERIIGTKYESEYADKFARSYSRKDTDRIIHDIEREERDNAVLAAGGWAGLGAQVVAGILDPTIFLPGGAIYRSAKGGYSAVRSGASIALAGGSQVALQESILQQSQQLRTGEESAFNIGTGTLLSAFLGAGAAKLLTKGEQQVLQKALETERSRMGVPPPVGAATSDLRTGQLKPLVPPVVSRAYEKGREAIAKVPVVGGALKAIAGLPEALAVKSNPMLRMMTAESLAARRAVADLAEIPLETVDNAAGITTSKFGIALDRDIKLTLHEAQVELYDAAHKTFAEYRFGDQKAFPAARSYLERKFGKSEGLTYDEFLAEVDTALRNGDVHPVPQVQALASRFRKWFDTVKEMAGALGIDLGDEVLGAKSFAPRVYDRRALTENRPEFVSRYVNWRKQDEAEKAALRDDLDRQWARYEKIQDKASDDAQRLMDRIEDAVLRWQGKTSKEAKDAIAKSRGRSDDVKAAKPQLKEAGDAIEKAIQRILDRTPKSDQELVAEAEQTVNQILSTPDGRLPKDEPGTVQGFSPKNEMGDLRGSLNARKLPMPDNDLLPFLVRDPVEYTMRHLRQSLADLGMVARFGDTEGTTVLKDIADDYDKLIREAPTAARRVELQQQKEAAIRDFAAMRDRIKGTYGFSQDAFLQSAGRVAESLKDFNVATLGGGFGLAQIGDFAGVVYRHGLMSAFKDAWVPFFARLGKLKDGGLRGMAGEWQSVGIGAETMLQTRMMDAMDMGDIYQHKSPFERTLRMTGSGVATLSGITLATDIQKVMATSAASNNILRWAKAVADGRASQDKITKLAAGGIDPDMAARIWQNFQNNGGSKVDGAMMPNLADWQDKTAARRFQAAVMRDVEIAVLTPGQEKPLFLSSPIISLFGQFKTFIAAANTRILLANLQRRDANALSGLLSHIAFGMMSYAAYTIARGDEFHERPQDWIKEGMDRSGALGWFGELNNMAAKATGGQSDIYRLLGADKPLSRYMSRGLVGNLLGPTYGLATDATQLTYATATGEWTESDTDKLRRVIPFQNLFYLRRLFDEVEKNGNALFGIEARAANE